MARRNTINRGTYWEVAFWLIFDSRGNVRLGHSPPALGSDERSLFVNTKVPKSLFKMPALRANITIGEKETPDTEIDVAAAEAALSEALGAKVEIIVKENENAHT